ncbi:MAG: T9SS type A sorting domain-containing protein, partial [Bacteroidales bacterium]|nr:T9SS type A sorting domain-containing protein [Bacteroidales bacterium]
YRISQALAAGKALTLKNCAELGGKVSIGTFAVQEKNSWLTPFVVTTADFRSTDPSGATGPRNSDGTLSHIEYMHLAAGSDLIDSGVDAGLPFAGTAPDLGCFETGLTAIVPESSDLQVLFYPNPVTETGYLRFTSPSGGRCIVRLFDVTGNPAATIADLQAEPGGNTLRLDFTGIRKGIYIYEITINSERIFVGRLARTTN